MHKPLRETLLEAFRQNPDLARGGFKEMAAQYDCCYDYVRNLAREFRGGTPANPPQEWSVEKAVEGHRDRAIAKALEEKNKQLLKQLDKTEKALDDALGVKSLLRYEHSRIEWDHKSANEGVAIAQFSDWHVAKRIEKKTVNGLNEYNPDIAKRRSQTCTENLLKLVKKERQDIRIENLVIHLGGDAINNYLHEGDAQQNYMSPLEEVIFAKQLLGNSLKTIAENGDFKKITLLCNRGNHPRLTKKMQADIDYKMNLEWMLYAILAQDFSDPLFEWHIPQSDIGYYQIGDKWLRYFHGHQIGYQGGVGGLTIPLTKKLMRWDKTKMAYYNVMGHFHNLSMPAPTCSLNGSLCGFDAFAQSLGFPFERAMQAFQIYDKKRGLTGRFPIFVD